MQPGLFHQVYGLLPEAMILVSAGGEVRAGNRAACELFQRDDLSGLRLSDLVADPEESVRRLLLRYERSGELLPGALTIRRREGGTVPCRAEGAVLRSAGSTDVLLRLLTRGATTSRFVVLNERIEALHREIAERQRAEAALASANETLKRANADLEQFAFSASHDLREPLRIIAIYSGRLRKECPDLIGPPREYLGFTLDAAKRMEALVADLLAYIQTGRGDEQVSTPRVSADAALDRALMNLQPAIDESGAVINREPLPLLAIDETNLVLLFQNLLGNALKYRGSATPTIHVSAIAEGDKWRISIHDNGIGISPQYKELIFGIFKRLHSTEYPGTGIGLAICRKIVHRYGGSIWVESDGEGQGSTFHFTIGRVESESGEDGQEAHGAVGGG